MVGFCSLYDKYRIRIFDLNYRVCSIFRIFDFFCLKFLMFDIDIRFYN